MPLDTRVPHTRQLPLPRIHIGTDHAGLELSRAVLASLQSKGYTVVDHGPSEYDPEDDYPVFCIKTAQAVMEERLNRQDSLGVVIGGSGNGEQIAANKVMGVRAALVWNESTARLARQHNNANIIAIGARQHTTEECNRFVEIFLTEPFSLDDRHLRRIAQIAQFENGISSFA